MNKRWNRTKITRKQIQGIYAAGFDKEANNHNKWVIKQGTESINTSSNTSNYLM